MIRFSENELVKTAKTIRKQIKDGKGLPKTMKMKDMDGKNHTLKITEYLGLYQQKNIHIIRHGGTPNYVTLNSKCGTLPTVAQHPYQWRQCAYSVTKANPNVPVP